jgi:hypothetical protein
MQLSKETARRSIALALICVVVVAAMALPVSAAPLKQEAQAAIASPTDGQTLQGNVTISGSASHPNFEHYEIAYGPDPNPNDAWQIFGGNNQPVSNGALGIWNTNVVADGTYMIRLRVVRRDSNYSEAFVRGLKVSNQQPVGTPTSIPPAPTFGAEATMTPIGTIIVEQPPTSEPTSIANAANSTTANSNTPRGAGGGSNTNSTSFTGLITSACLTGLTWTMGASILFGVIYFGRRQYRHYLRRQRKRFSDADTRSTPSSSAQ